MLADVNVNIAKFYRPTVNLPNDRLEYQYYRVIGIRHPNRGDLYLSSNGTVRMWPVERKAQSISMVRLIVEIDTKCDRDDIEQMRAIQQSIQSGPIRKAANAVIAAGEAARQADRKLQKFLQENPILIKDFNHD